MKSFYDMMRLVEVETLQKKDPVPLSAVDQNVAKIAVVSGQNDGDQKDDSAQANMKASGPVSNLRPTQRTLVSDKVLNFALAYLGGETWMNLQQMDAIVSQDNAIMDGHHRWAAALIVNPNMSVGYTQISLPLEKLISILNVYTKGALNKSEGNPDAGETLAQAFANLDSKIRSAYTNGFQAGRSSYSTEEVQSRLGKMPGAEGDPQKGLEQMVANANQVASNQQMTNSASSLARADMPVIDKDKVAQLVSDLQSGKIDAMQPYSKDVLNAIDGGTRPQKTQGQPPQANPMQVAQQSPMNTNPPAQNQQLQAAHTLHQGSSMNEWLVLSGIIKE